MSERDREFADAAQVLQTSVLLRVLRTVIDGVARPFEGCRMPALNAPAYTVAAIVCVLTHAILLQFLPDRLAPVKPLAYWMVVAFAALVAVAGLLTARNKTTAIADSSAGTANTRNS